MDWDLNHLSRYPFIEGARDWVRSRKISMEEMLGRDNLHIQEIAYGRIEDSVHGRGERTGSFRTRDDIENRLLSYPVIIWVVPPQVR